MGNRKEYYKSYHQKHKEHSKDCCKAWYELHKEEHNARCKAWRESHREEFNAKMRAYYQAHKKEHNARVRAYRQDDLHSFKDNIRSKSRYVLKRMNLHIDGYEIHHCFGYEDANKFIYISKSLHLKIHEFLRDNNIPADSNHWIAIRDIVNSADEFTYIKC